MIMWLVLITTDIKNKSGWSDATWDTKIISTHNFVILPLSSTKLGNNKLFLC